MLNVLAQNTASMYATGVIVKKMYEKNKMVTNTYT